MTPTFYMTPMRMFTAKSKDPVLFEQLGGKPAVDVVVENFYEKILSDEKVNFMFEKTDMKKQKRHMKGFITMAFGGPSLYTGETMRKVHAKVNKDAYPTEDHFGVVGGHLVATLQELDVAQDLIDQVVVVVHSVKDDVLGK